MSEAPTKSGHTVGIPIAQPVDIPDPNRRARDMQSPDVAFPRRLCSIHEAATYLAVSDWTVRRMVWTGALPHIRRGRRILLDLRDLDAWIDRAKVNGV